MLFLVLNCSLPGAHFTGLLSEIGRKETNLPTIPIASCMWIFVPTVVKKKKKLIGLGISIVFFVL